MKIGTNIINPHSKFRRKINQFDLMGDFTKGRKKLYSLIDTFHEEYILNYHRVPKLQWEFLSDDIRYIDSKLVSLEILKRNEDEDIMILNKLNHYWIEIKTKLEEKRS